MMKTQTLHAIVFFLTMEIAAFTGCKKSDEHLQPAQHGVKRTKGNPAGLSVSEDIDADGGELTSADGRIKLIIPPGAIAGTTKFTIQPINNTLPHGIGVSYRLLPEGIHFDLPVTVIFRYGHEELHGNENGNLQIAYEDSSGIWQQPQNQVIDTINKTLQTSSRHFSDWAIYETFIIVCDKNIIGLNESANLKIQQIMSLGGLNGGEITDTVLLDPSYSSTKWKLNGGGALTILSPVSKATYMAPSVYPTPNPVNISVEIPGAVTLEARRARSFWYSPLQCQIQHL